jgi:hypothetical protein
MVFVPNYTITLFIIKEVNGKYLLEIYGSIPFTINLQTKYENYNFEIFRKM